jgi:hypothetical protein
MPRTTMTDRLRAGFEFLPLTPEIANPPESETRAAHEIPTGSL